MSEVEAKKETKSANEKEVKVEVENGCFVCHGTGHWAREVIIIVVVLFYESNIYPVYIAAFNLFDR